MALSVKEIDNARPAEKQYKLADGGGLSLLVTPSATKLWRWRYRFGGTEKMMALGEYPLVTLKEARERHFLARKTLASGIDLMAERKALIAANKGRPKLDNVSAITVSKQWLGNGGSDGRWASLPAMRTPSCGG